MRVTNSNTRVENLCFAYCGISATKFKSPVKGSPCLTFLVCLSFLYSLRPQSSLGEARWVHSLGALLENLGLNGAPSALESSRWAGWASGTKTGVVNSALALMSRRAWAGHPGIRPAPDTPISTPPPHPTRSQPCCEAGAPSSGRGCALLRVTAEADSDPGHAAMAEAVRQELSALAAIFCGPHEWEMLSCSGEYPVSHPAATAGSRETWSHVA